MTAVLTPETLAGLTVTPVSDAPAYLNMMIYGDPGAGKTVLAGTSDSVEEMRPVLFVDVEGGTYSVRKFNPDVKVIRVYTWDQMLALYNALYDDAGETYRTVVLDSLSEIQKLSMGTIMKAVVTKDADRDAEVPAIRDWGKNSEQIRRLVRAFRDLPVHTIITVLAKSEVDKRTGLTRIVPSLPGKLAFEVAGYCDVLAYLYPKVVTEAQGGDNMTHRLMTVASTEKAVAKDRSDNIPEVLIDPDMPTIYNHYFNNDSSSNKETETE